MNITTVVLAAVVFALAGTLVFAAIAPYLSDVDAQIRLKKPCSENSPNAGNPPPCGPTRIKLADSCK